MTAAARAVWCPDALLPSGWASGVMLRWDEAGILENVSPGVSPEPGVSVLAGPTIPGLPNLHSHAFQRGFAGLTECRSREPDSGGDSFWTWRETMYRFASRIDPEQLEIIATWLYSEMLTGGYTSVCEFHYLHHRPDGQRYSPTAELGLALLRAAEKVGIGITLLPVLYQSSGFGGSLPLPEQRRFIASNEEILLMMEALGPQAKAQRARIGLAPHSLRAVPPTALREAVDELTRRDPAAPIHIHIAEQKKEVDDCVAWSGQRPVEYLLSGFGLDRRWCLVHATHMTSEETAAAAATGAVAGICPSTEANLGDGIFTLVDWRRHGGNWGVGSDSHTIVNAAEELMQLEYSQRLATRRRNIVTSAEHPDVATALLLEATAGGALATGRPVCGLTVGQQADFVVLDAEHVALQGLSASDMLSAHVFASHRTSAIIEVWTAGRRRVTEHRHTLHDDAAGAFVAVRNALIRS